MSDFNPLRCFHFWGLQIPPILGPCKTTQERWLKLNDLIPCLKSKHVLTSRCLMSPIGLLASMEKMVPEECLHMRPFQFDFKEHCSPPTSEARGSIPVTTLSGKAGSCLPLVGSLQYRTLANPMYWFPLPFQLPVVI